MIVVISPALWAVVTITAAIAYFVYKRSRPTPSTRGDLPSAIAAAGVVFAILWTVFGLSDPSPSPPSSTDTPPAATPTSPAPSIPPATQ